MSAPIVSADLLFNRILNKTKLRHIQIAVSVAELGSVQKTSRVLGISQPAATKAIADLERGLGVNIFERHARGMRPSKAGREILPLIRRLVDDAKLCTEAVAAQRNGASFSVSVASVSAGISGVLSHALPMFAADHPNIAVDVQEVDVYRLASLAAEGSQDLLICREPTELPQGYVFEPLMDDRHVVVAPKGHPLERMRHASARTLSRFKWLLPPRGVPARALFERFWTEAGLTPPLCQVQTRSPLLIMATILHRNLLSLAPFTVLRFALDAGTLVTIKCDVQQNLGPMGAMWHDGNLSEAAGLLLDAMREAGRDITNLKCPVPKEPD